VQFSDEGSVTGVHHVVLLQVNSCTANATAGAYEYLVKRHQVSQLIGRLPGSDERFLSS
jgi:hypothetical protein